MPEDDKPHFTLPPDLASLPKQDTPPALRRDEHTAPAPPPISRSVTPEAAPRADQAPAPPHKVSQSLTPAPPPRVEPTQPPPRSDGPPVRTIAAAAVGLFALVAIAGGAWMFLGSSPAEPPPPPPPKPAPAVVAEPAPAPPPAPPPEPAPEPATPPIVEWDALGPRLARDYGAHLGLWNQRGAEPPGEADRPAVIAVIRTDGYADRDLEIRTPDGSQTATLTAKSLPERELAGDGISLPTKDGRVEVFNPIYAPSPVTITELWTLDGEAILRKDHAIAASCCYGLRSTTRLADDAPSGSKLTLQLLPPEGGPLAERTWTLRSAP